jgi:Homeodomain-like domain
VDQQAELRALVNSPDVPASVGTRARIVLWRAEGRQKKDVAELAGVSRPTVDLWLGRFAAEGVAGLLDQAHGAGREQVSARSGGGFWSDRARVGVASVCGEAVAGQRDQASSAGHVQGQ